MSAQREKGRQKPVDSKMPSPSGPTPFALHFGGQASSCAAQMYVSGMQHRGDSRRAGAQVGRSVRQRIDLGSSTATPRPEETRAHEKTPLPGSVASRAGRSADILALHRGQNTGRRPQDACARAMAGLELCRLLESANDTGRLQSGMVGRAKDAIHPFRAGMGCSSRLPRNKGGRSKWKAYLMS